MTNTAHSRTAAVVIFACLLIGVMLLPALGPVPGPGDPPRPVVFSVTEQTVITLAAFLLKPLYQILSLVIIIMLWKHSGFDYAAIRLAMVAFLLGENACTLNYLFFHEQSVLLEFLHMYGMIVCFGLVVYALMTAIDDRIIHYSAREHRCGLLPLCGQCYKYGDSRCTAWLLFLFVIPATAVLIAMPLTASLGGHSYSGTIFGTTVSFGHPLPYQALEVRVFPWFALVFLILSFLILFFSGEKGFHPSKIWYAMGWGPLGFSLMRFLCYWGYRENPLWADAWEEITEFLFIAAVFRIVLRDRAVSRHTLPSQTQTYS